MLLRRTTLHFVLLVPLIAAAGCNALYDSVGGGYAPFSGGGWRDPARLQTDLSPQAMALVQDAFDGLDLDALGDMHVHPLTLQLHPYWLNPWRPILYGRTMVYFAAAGVRREPRERFEEAYIERLVELICHKPVPTSGGHGRFYALAMDHYYREDDTIDEMRSWFVVSNEYTWELAQRYPEIFVPVMSVHPFRPDAIEELRRWAEKGVRHVKWIPNSYGFDPADPRLDDFYRTMAEHDIVLLCHTGDEHAFEWDEQEWGNPLRLRRALDHGVKVVAFHAASHGVFEDLDYVSDDPKKKPPLVEGWDLLMRMMDDPQYDGLLFAEISAMTFFNHVGPPLRKLLERQDLHHRFVNGSDYPWCAVSVAIQPTRLARRGFLTQYEARLLREIYYYNPLLYDFVVKRTIRHPKTGERLRPELFEVPEAIR